MPQGSDAVKFFDELRAAHPELQREYDRIGPRFKLLLDIAELMERDCVSQRELARRLGKSPAVVSRLLSGNHASSLDSIADCARALGYRVEVKLVPERAPNPRESSKRARSRS